METSKEEEVERLLETTPLAVGTGAVVGVGVKVKHLGIFMEALKYRWSVIEANQISGDKLYVILHREEEYVTLEGRGIDNQMYSTKEYTEREDMHLKPI